MANTNCQPQFRNYRNPQDGGDGPLELAEKGWGKEFWMLNNDKLCLKVMTLKNNKRCSLHFHLDKDEIFLVVSGSMMFVWVDPLTAEEKHLELVPGDTVYVPRGLPHQFGGTSEKPCVFVEASTHHEDGDSYRVRQGHSQLGVG